jgi:hypothetical protein
MTAEWARALYFCSHERQIKSLPNFTAPDLGFGMALRPLVALCRPAASQSFFRTFLVIPNAGFSRPISLDCPEKGAPGLRRSAGTLDAPTRASTVYTRAVSDSSSASMTSQLAQRAQAVLDFW